jgi:mono/diheme cytochrome c family protein
MSRRNTATAIAATVLWVASAVGGGERIVTTITAAELQTPRELPGGQGADTVRARCISCHGIELIIQQRLTREGWLREVEKMTSWGALVAPGEQDALLDFLVASFGIEPTRTADGTTSEGAALLQARCQTCHDLRLIEQQRLNADGWARELDKMISWGAPLTGSEKEVLVEHLARRRAMVP